MDNKLQDIEYKLESIEKDILSIKDAHNKTSLMVTEVSEDPLKEPLHIQSRKTIKNTIPISLSICLPGTSAATSGNYNAFWVSDFSCSVKSVSVFYSTASSSGTVNLYKTVSGTAIGSGTAILSSAISTSATANTTYSGSVKTDDSISLKQGDILGLVSGGTLTSLANLSVTINIQLL